jgi:hypothetical protein
VLITTKGQDMPNSEVDVNSPEFAEAVIEGLLAIVRKEVRDLDDSEALRNVLLMLLAVTAGEGGPAAKRVHTWILKDFVPVSSRFTNNVQDWCHTHSIKREYDTDGDCIVAVVPERLLSAALDVGGEISL